jgi:phosphatidylglycerol:prolipoprotein diacylglycerol transferase
MYPWIVVPLVNWALRTSHLCLLLALIICSWHGARQIRGLEPAGWRRDRIALLVVAAAPWLGGHLHFVVNNWGYATSRPWVLLGPWNGLHAGGAMIALVLTAPVVLRRRALPLRRIADALVPTVGIGIIVGRLGCFAEGCCFGWTCRWPWCVPFPAGAYVYDVHAMQGKILPGASLSAPVHPLQLYFAMVGVALIVLSRGMAARKRYDGQIALVALLLFSVTAAILEPLRADYDGRAYWGALPQLQWTALLMSLVSLAAMRAARIRSRATR